MGTTKRLPNNNDLAVAKLFNTILLSILLLVRKAKEMQLPQDYEINELNRVYVLLVNELENLYDNNPKLVELKPEPLWRRFDILKGVSWQIITELDDQEKRQRQTHDSRLERLCIITGSEIPEFSADQLKLVESAIEAIANYNKKLKDYKSELDDAWYVSKYWLDYEANGAIVINGVLKLQKAQIGSTIDQLLEQAFKNEGVLFTPKLQQTSRNLSTVLSSAGFTPVLRQLFFPIVDKRKGVLFHSTVTSVEAGSESIETFELDLLLKTLGAEINYFN